jgi:hypothetical protein
LLIVTGITKYSQRAFVHDELGAIEASSVGTWANGYMKLNHYKPRLVPNALCAVIYRASPNDRTLALATSITLHLLTLLSIFIISRNALKLRLYISTALLCALALSRFNFFHYTEANLGMIEGLAHLFFVISLGAGIMALKKARFFWGYIAALSAVVCILSHERLAIPLSASMLIPAVLWVRTRRTTPCLALAATIVLALGSFYITSRFIASPSALYGTGGTPLTLEPFRSAYFFQQGLINAWGINNGEPYLAGNMFSLLRPPFGPLMAICLISVAAGFIFKLTRKTSIPAEKSAEQCAPVILIYISLVILGAVAAASLTFRQEMRWLYSAHIAVLLLCACIYAFIIFRLHFIK